MQVSSSSWSSGDARDDLGIVQTAASPMHLCCLCRQGVNRRNRKSMLRTQPFITHEPSSPVPRGHLHNQQTRLRFWTEFEEGGPLSAP
jgi:hypothetical protein